MSETLIRLEPVEVAGQEIFLPSERSVVYPGSDAWVQVERGQSAPGSNPAWLPVQKCPDTPGTPAVPGKSLSPTVTAPVLTGAQWVFGASSLDTSGGTGRALSTPDHADFDFGAGDFTLEGRFRFSVIRKALFGQQNPDGVSELGWEWTMDVMPSGTPGFTFYCSANGTSWIQFDQAFTVNLNQWYHMACVRSGNSLMFFVDGTQIGSSQSITATIRNSSAPVRILGDGRAAGNDFQGYADELRISKGIARYTSNFTVPGAPFTKDAYTSLLCHFEGTAGTTPTNDDTGTPAGPSTPVDPGSNPAWLHLEN